MKAFRLFSLLFSYPTEETINTARELAKQPPLSGLKSAKALGKTSLESLQTEYTSLFVNSFPTLLCPPYESFYREGTVYGNTINEVVAFYGKRGLSYIYQGEPPDHLCVELDFLAEAGSQEFLARMRQWVPQFMTKVKHTKTVYRVFARELEELLAMDWSPDIDEAKAHGAGQAKPD